MKKNRAWLTFLRLHHQSHFLHWLHLKVGKVFTLYQGGSFTFESTWTNFSIFSNPPSSYLGQTVCLLQQVIITLKLLFNTFLINLENGTWSIFCQCILRNFKFLWTHRTKGHGHKDQIDLKCLSAFLLDSKRWLSLRKLQFSD